MHHLNMARRQRRFIGLALAGFLALGGCGALASQTAALRFEVTPGAMEGRHVPVHTLIEMPEGLAGLPLEEVEVRLRSEGNTGAPVAGQLVPGASGQTELWWVLPEAGANTPTRWHAEFSRRPKPDPEAFSFKDQKGEHLDLFLGQKRVLRYMYAFDPSTPERLHETYKPYHHVFDAAGNAPITKGPGGLYTHHRGIFIGWNRLAYEGKEYDFWHMKGVNQQHDRFEGELAGPVLARSKMRILWKLEDGSPVVEEHREITVFRQPGPALFLLEFRTRITAVNEKVLLGGDPEHGGFQYRPHNAVAEGPEEVKAAYLFHADGIDAHKDQDLPWVAMSYGLEAKRYTVQHMNHPENPSPSVYSAYRDYGRFGAFFVHEIEAGASLNLRYRIYVSEGDLPARDEMTHRYSAFIHPPEVRRR